MASYVFGQQQFSIKEIAFPAGVINCSGSSTGITTSPDGRLWAVCNNSANGGVVMGQKTLGDDITLVNSWHFAEHTTAVGVI
jgi:hypothetical protein